MIPLSGLADQGLSIGYLTISFNINYLSSFHVWRKAVENTLKTPIWGPKHSVWCEINTSFTFGYVLNCLCANCVCCFESLSR